MSKFKFYVVLLSLISFVPLIGMADPFTPRPREMTKWAYKSDGTACNSTNRRVLVIPAGYTNLTDFRNAYSQMLTTLSQTPGASFVTLYKDLICYVGVWISGGSFDSANPNFSSRFYFRRDQRAGLALNANQVYSHPAIQDELRNIKTLSATVLFNTPLPDPGMVSNYVSSSIGSVTVTSVYNRQVGISKIAAGDLQSPFILTHEIGHAAFNFGDEYSEAGLDHPDLHSLDSLNPALSMVGVSNLTSHFDVKLSEILGANGLENVDITQTPSRVSTTGYNGPFLGTAGGLGFSQGVFHDGGASIMGNPANPGSSGDGFAFAQTADQETVLQSAFNSSPTYRPNDRIRTAGPINNPQYGINSLVPLMIFDGDRNNHFHPTRSYDVQLGYNKRVWGTCWWGPFPYPCYSDTWTTTTSTLPASPNYIDLSSAGSYLLLNLVPQAVCQMGLQDLTGTIDLCDSSVSSNQVAPGSYPPIRFQSPYQIVYVRGQQISTQYYWRFRAYNGVSSPNYGYSGWSEWGHFKTGTNMYISNINMTQ